VLGGVDVTGAHLFTIHPHGSTDKLPYVSMGERVYEVCLTAMEICI
jgi:20S proteasome alpha/beta subunit